MTPERFAEVERVCQAALDLSPDLRGAFLDDACRGDAGLRAEVDGLLAAASRATSLLAMPPLPVPPALTPGQRLGPYEIVSRLGAGGMGEVYKARDTRLERTVAIKVLPADLGGDAERRARFEREARTVAGISHPHICPLFDVGTHDGAMFLVMEHLAGETLADRLNKGPVPVEEALTLAAQVADALAAAHHAGVVHRDLKPANVMLTKAGAKLLDFGLAKLTAHGALRHANRTGSAGASLTGEGVIVGTLQYMAPEQLEGKEPDSRSDLWALGAILYEMLTGRRPFEAASTAGLIGAILEREPPPSAALARMAPPAVDRIVRRCLSKDPDARWQTAADLAAALRWAGEQPASPAAPAAAAGVWSRRRLVAPTAVSLLLVAAVLAGLVGRRWFGPRGGSAVARHFSVTLSGDGVDTPSAVAISPDGSTLAVAGATRDGSAGLFVRRFDQRRSTAVPGTTTAMFPRFSDDGESIAFFAGQGLSRAFVTGGSAVATVFKGESDGIAWAPGGELVFCNFSDLSLSRLTVDGRVETLLKVGQEDAAMSFPMWPELLPGGDLVLFNVLQNGEPTVWLHSIHGGGRARRLPLVGLRPRYLAQTGHLVYQLGGQLFAVPFDPKRPDALKADAGRPVIDGVGSGAPFEAEWDVSRNGTLVYLAPTTGRLAWSDREGRRTPLLSSVPPAKWIAVSPDGQRAVVGTTEGPANRLYTTGLTGSPALTRLTPGDDDWYGVFTANSKEVLYMSGSGGQGWNIWVTRADGGGPPRRVTESRHPQKASAVHPDGARFLYNELHDGEGDIWEREMDRPGSARPIVATPSAEWEAAYSPDAKWIAYEARVGRGRLDIYVQRYPDGPRRMVSVAGGRHPVWAPDGKELFYDNSSGTQLMSVRVENGAPVGEPRRLFTVWNVFGSPRTWDVMRAGGRFLVGENVRPAQVFVVLDWFEDLKKKVPAER